MTHLTSAQVLAIALQCSSVDPDLIVSIAQRESGLDPAIVRTNRNSTRDFGLMKINGTDFSLLGLTGRTVFDLCRSVRAASDLIAILSRYNDARHG
jgi:Transglycosylase SLT domain